MVFSDCPVFISTVVSKPGFLVSMGKNLKYPGTTSILQSGAGIQ